MKKAEIVPLFIIIFFMLSCDLGVISQYDGVISSIMLALLFPQYAFILLIAISAYQDSPGMSTWGWYLSFVSVFLILIAHNIHYFIKKVFKNRLFVFTYIVITYGLVISSFYDITGIYPQAESRPYYVSGLLMYIMVAGGFLARLELLKTRKEKAFKKTLLIIVFHSIAVILYQMFVSASFLSSAAGFENISESVQLLDKTAIGFSRLTGTYNTPNGFALCLVLLSLLYFSSLAKLKFKSLMIYSLVIVFFSVAALSKGLIAFSLLSIMFYSLFLIKRKIVRIFLYFLVFITVALIAILPTNIETLLTGTALSDSLRLDNVLNNQNLGYRGEAWATILKEFTITSWLFGTGISHWPIFFSTHLSFSLSDPHTLVFSYIGSYGILGVMYFIYLLYSLIKAKKPSSQYQYFLIGSLLSIFIVKDLMSIPYIFGNTPLTFLIWLLISTLLIPSKNHNSNN